MRRGGRRRAGGCVPRGACGDPRSTIAVTGPAFVALFHHVTQADVDAGAELTETLADFQYHADAIEPRLAAAGIGVHQVYADPLRLVEGGSASPRRTFAADSTRYVYLAPGREPRTLPVIATDIELLEIPADYFGIPALVSGTHP